MHLIHYTQRQESDLKNGGTTVEPDRRCGPPPIENFQKLMILLPSDRIPGPEPSTRKQIGILLNISEKL